MEPVNLLLFGDQTVPKLPTIRALVNHSKTSPTIRRFLREAADVVQIESSKLNPEERGWFQDFNSILGLAEENAKREEPNQLIATVLMCIGRLGELILYTEENPSILGSADSPVEVLGICTGLIPAAAVVASDSSEILRLSTELIAIAFRLGHELDRRSKLIDTTGGNWATTILGATVDGTQAILDEFHRSNEIPQARHVAIGVVGRGWLTLFGASSTMEYLWEWSPELSQAPRVKTDSGGAVHTAHLPEVNLARVLGNSPVLDTPIRPKAEIVSTGTCKAYDGQDIRSLLSQMIPDIAQNVLYLVDTIDEVISNLVKRGDITMTVVGETGHLPIVERALQERDIRYRISHHTPRPGNAMRGGSDAIAVVGMSGRFPGSDSVQEFWEGLLGGKDHHTKIPKERFDLDKYYDPTGKARNSTTVQHGCFLDNPGMFDHRLFNVSPREAVQMDAAQRLLLTTSYEALEMAGYCPDGTLSTSRERMATYVGQNSDDWREIGENAGIDIYYVPGIARAFAPGRLNYHFKWGGGSYSLDCACASSAATISLASSALIARECDTALAGGASILNSPNPFIGLGKGGFLSTTGNCKTYSDKADGYCRGEGIGVVVLKRLEDAISDNDNILATVNGFARTYSSDATSITHPSEEAQRKTYEQILQQSSTDPTEVSYVEMHGTGTQSGDLTEMRSVLGTFGRNRTKENPLVVGAVKANVGHGESVAGVAGLIKLLMMLRTRRIPPQPGLPIELNKNFPALGKKNVYIAGENMKLNTISKSGGVKVFLNSFDAAGGNSALLIEEAPKKPEKTEDPRMHHVVTISARTACSLEKNKRRLLEYLIEHPGTNIEDVAYTKSARRIHEPLRAAYPATSVKEIVQLINADLSKQPEARPKKRGPKATVVFVFTGQGSQYGGMGNHLFQHSPSFRELLQTYENLCVAQGLPPFVNLISRGNLDISTKSVVQIQLAIVALEIALAQTWKAWGIKPDTVLGHSLGEYAALYVSGVLSLSDTLHLVGRRARLMQEKLNSGTYAMLAVGKDLGTTTSRLSRNSFSSCEVACVNAPEMTVVSGQIKEVAELQKQMNAEGSQTTLLRVKHGFHSRQLDPIIGDLEARGITYSKPAIPIASTLLGEVVTDADTFSSKYLVRQARERVNFVGALEASRNAGFVHEGTLWIEMGPDPVCLSMIRKTLDVPTTRLLPTVKSSENNWKTTSTSLAAVYEAGISVNWPEYHKDFKGSLTLLDLPTYAFDEKNFWTPYEKPEISSVGTSALSQKTDSVPSPQFSTASLQKIQKEEVADSNISVTFASHTSNADLFEAIQGHDVDGITVCPASVFCDMALSTAEYIHRKLKPNEPKPKLSLSEFEITHPLVVTEINPEQVVYITGTSTLDSDTVDITFRSTDSPTHGSCKVVFGDKENWMSQQGRTLFLLNKRISSLIECARTGSGHRLQKQIVYRMFNNLVTYGDKYKGIEEVYLDSDFNDAVGIVRTSKASECGNFLNSPYWIDAVVHLAGFLLNGNLKYPHDVAFLSTGFEAWRIFEPLSEQKSYTSYVCFQEPDNRSVIVCDAYVFDGNDLVVAVSGIQFQRMKKVALKSILRKGTPSSHRAPQIAGKSKQGLPGKISEEKVGVRRSYSAANGPSDAEYSPTSPKVLTPTSGKDEPLASTSSANKIDLVGVVLKVVANETGCDLQDIAPDQPFADMGVDSLMSITIIAKVKEETDIELAASLFNDHPTVGELNQALGPDEAAGAEDYSASAEAPPRQDHVDDTTIDTAPLTNVQTNQDKELEHPCDTIPLQGRASSTETPLFLLCDGTGSAAAYIQLPMMDSGMRVYGVQSPFVNNPLEYTCSIEKISSIFVKAIRKTQPTGPYILGGFSSGAIYAYEIARQLIEAGETVQGLLLVGMHAPVNDVAEVYEPTIEQIEEAGLLPGKSRAGRVAVPLVQKQKEHIRSTLRALIAYKPVPMTSQQRPRASAVILSKSDPGASMVRVEGNDNKLVQWVNAHSLGSNEDGWKRLLGKAEYYDLEGVEAFSLIERGNVKSFGKVINSVVEKLRT